MGVSVCHRGSPLSEALLHLYPQSPGMMGGGGCPRPLGTCSQEHAHFLGTCIPDSDSGDGTCGETLAREPQNTVQNTVQNAERHGNIPKMFSPAAGCILLLHYHLLIQRGAATTQFCDCANGMATACLS